MMKTSSGGIKIGEQQVGDIHDRVTVAYAERDRERMEYLNERIAAEPKKKKYTYKRQSAVDGKYIIVESKGVYARRDKP